jgi:hypothetical protein
MVIHYAWVIAFTGVLVLLLAQGFGRMSYSVILPSMKDGLLLTYTQVGLIGTGNFIFPWRLREDFLQSVSAFEK